MTDAVKTANPAPLGAAAFGLTTVVLSSINAGPFPSEALPAVVPLAFSFGGFAQMIAGILESRNANTFGTVAFISYGAFWWYAFLLWTIGAGWIKPPDPHGVGVALLMWSVFTLYMWVATFRINVALWQVFLLLWITFFLLAGGNLGVGAMSHKLGGWSSLATGVATLYLSFADVPNEAFRSTVIKVGPPILKS
jgi:succinate-acetate transporter protein